MTFRDKLVGFSNKPYKFNTKFNTFNIENYKFSSKSYKFSIKSYNLGTKSYNLGTKSYNFSIKSYNFSYEVGKLVSFDYNKETASITSLIADCRDHASTELATLNVKSILDFLETCNTKFKDFYATRGDAASVLANVPPFYKLRKEVGDHYKTMVNDLESLQRFIPASAAQIGDLITRVNVEIDKFRLLVPTTPVSPTPPTP